jgi:hypothetical protein
MSFLTSSASLPNDADLGIGHIFKVLFHATWVRFIFSVRPTAANATACFQTPSSRNNDHHDS